MNDIAKKLKAYIEAHPFQAGDGEDTTVLEQLYLAYAESHESDPAEISSGFQELEEFLHTLPREDNNAVFNLCCRLCSAYGRKAFIDGLQYGCIRHKNLYDLCPISTSTINVNPNAKGHHHMLHLATYGGVLLHYQSDPVIHSMW